MLPQSATWLSFRPRYFALRAVLFRGPTWTFSIVGEREKKIEKKTHNQFTTGRDVKRNNNQLETLSVCVVGLAEAERGFERYSWDIRDRNTHTKSRSDFFSIRLSRDSWWDHKKILLVNINLQAKPENETRPNDLLKYRVLLFFQLLRRIKDYRSSDYGSVSWENPFRSRLDSWARGFFVCFAACDIRAGVRSPLWEYDYAISWVREANRWWWARRQYTTW